MNEREFAEKVWEMSVGQRTQFFILMKVHRDALKDAVDPQLIMWALRNWFSEYDEEAIDQNAAKLLADVDIG